MHKAYFYADLIPITFSDVLTDLLELLNVCLFDVIAI